MSSNGNQSPSLWYRFVTLNPALVRGLIMAVFAFIASIGIIVSDSVPDNLIGLVLALSAIIQALWTRQAVVPEAKVVVWKDENNNLRAGDAVPAPVVSGDRKAETLRALEEAAYIKGKVF